MNVRSRVEDGISTGWESTFTFNHGIGKLKDKKKITGLDGSGIIQ